MTFIWNNILIIIWNYLQKLYKAVKLNQQMHLDENHLCSIKGIVFFTAYLQMTIPEYKKTPAIEKAKGSLFCEGWL